MKSIKSSMKRNGFLINIAVFFMVSSFMPFCQASIILEATKFIYDGSKDENQLSITNMDNQPYLIQSWVDKNGLFEQTPSKEPIPFIVTPPLFKILPQETNQIRLVLTGHLPQDRESMYWLDVRQIPKKMASDKNGLQIIIKNRIKLIYRPEEIANIAHYDFRQIQFLCKDSHTLAVKNPSPYYLSFSDLMIEQHHVPLHSESILPMSEHMFTLPFRCEGSHVSWTRINDFNTRDDTIISDLQR